jgi:hypothetical protein
MLVTEKIQSNLQRLPASLQQEVLDFVEFLLTKAELTASRQEEVEWSRAALAQAMREMDEEEGAEAPVYTFRDLKERYE